MSAQHTAAVRLVDIQSVAAKLLMVRVSFSASYQQGPPDWYKVAVGKAHTATLTAILEQVAPGEYTPGL